MNSPTVATDHPRTKRRWAGWLAAAALCLGMAACGGGGGGSGSGGSGGSGSGGDGTLDIDKLPVAKLTVNDSFGAPIADAAVEGPTQTVTTNANGVALVVIDTPDRRATLKVSRESFVDNSVAASARLGRVNEFTVVLQRATAPAGASLASRNLGFETSVDAGRRQLNFEIELVLVDGLAQPLENLDAADFELLACTPSADTERADCVRGNAAGDDKAYAPLGAAPAALTRVAGGAVKPYAAALLLDQSGSIRDSDPTGARLYSAKAFMGSLGSDDRALLAAFADGGALPAPLTVYGPFRDAASAPGYFTTLDALAGMVGGGTPLYDSVDRLRETVASDATLPAGLTRAVVLFTDGTDTACTGAEVCRARRLQSIQDANQSGVRLFTVGLSSQVDVVALGELASQTGGAFLYADSAEQLLPLYGSLGRLLSLSLPTYRLQWTVQADSADVFRAGHTLLGKVRVRTGTRSIDVPFLVGVP